jgi:uncharacterized protein
VNPTDSQPAVSCSKKNDGVASSAATISRFCARHPWKVISVTLLLSVLSVWALAFLPVRTSRQALLPRNTEVFRRFQQYLEKFGAASDLIVVLEGVSAPELERFASNLSEQLRHQPEIGQASEHLDLRFFLEHAYLLIPPEGLEQFSSIMKMMEGMNVPQESPGLDEGLLKVRSWLENHPPLSEININLQTAKEGVELLLFFFDEWQRFLDSKDVPETIDWSALLARHGAERLGRGYFTSYDNKMFFVFVHPKDSSEEYRTLKPFIERVRTVADELIAKAKTEGRPVPTVAFTGLPAVVFEEYTAIQNDITLVLISAAIFVLLLILVVVRSMRWALVIFIPMGVGVLWSSGLTLFTIGHLTIITSGFTAILFGLGVDYGIFTSSRIAEERRTGQPLVESISGGMGASFKAVLTAGGASVLIFGALSSVEFPGFAELGIVAATGVLLVLVSTVAVQPALYALFPPRMKDAFSDSSMAGKKRESSGFAVSKFTAAFVVGVALLACGIGVWEGVHIPFDYDVLSMLPKNSESARYQRRMVAESDYQSEVVIFTASSIEQARKINADASLKKSIARVQSITNLFPEDAATRAVTAREIGRITARSAYVKKTYELDRVGLNERTFEQLRETITLGLEMIGDSEEQAFSAGHANLVKSLDKLRTRLEEISERLSASPETARVRSEMYLHVLLDTAREGLRVISAWERAAPLTPEALPPTLKDRFFAADGTMAVYAFPAESVYNSAALDRLMNDVYNVSQDATGFPTTHQVFSKTVVKSFVQGTLLALGVALLWILLVLKSIRRFLIAALPLLLGGGWMLGVLYVVGMPYNYANIIALPLVMGLAVDYGVWFGHRRYELKDLTSVQVALVAGKAILLAAGTVLAGLGAITLANYQGISSMGLAITVGLLCCLVTSLFIGPAIAQLIYRRKA